MGPGCESGSRFFWRALSRIMDRMDKTIEHIEKTLQAEAATMQTEAAGMQAEGATAYADAARASDAVGFEREDAERTLSLTVSYNGGPFCGFARQPGKLTVQLRNDHLGYALTWFGLAAALAAVFAAWAGREWYLATSPRP